MPICPLDPCFPWRSYLQGLCNTPDSNQKTNLLAATIIMVVVAVAAAAFVAIVVTAVS